MAVKMLSEDNNGLGRIMRRNNLVNILLRFHFLLLLTQSYKKQNVMQHKIVSIFIFTWLLSIISASAVTISVTDFNSAQCRGSAALYPSDISRVATPDTLVPVFINHVGRHGARFPHRPRG